MNEALDLTILDSGSNDHAIGLARSAYDCAIAQLPFGKDLKSLSEFRNLIEDAVRGVRPAPSANELRDFGKQLFSFTFRGEIAELYNRLPKDAVRVNIVCNRAEIQNLPWEYLQEPGKQPSPQRGRSVVRVVPTIGLPGPEPQPLKPPINVLFASAAPTDQGGVDWEDVQAAIQRAFNATLPGGMNLKVVDGADPRILRQTIAAERFDIFHFSGHGEVKNGKGRLVLENRKTHKSEYLDTDQVASILSGRGIRLVILSACMTATGDFKDEFSVMASALIRSGIPAVVANQMPIANKTVAFFVGALYETLLRTGNVDTATTDGRIALDIDLGQGSASGLEWGIPTLYRHYAGAQLYKL